MLKRRDVFPKIGEIETRLTMGRGGETGRLRIQSTDGFKTLPIYLLICEKNQR
jgi:hypothetical protein